MHKTLAKHHPNFNQSQPNGPTRSRLQPIPHGRARSTTSTSVAAIDIYNIHIVNKLYTQPVPTQDHPPPPPPSQSYALPGDICTTILHASCHKGTGVNADSIDIFIDLIQANIESTSINLNFILNQIYQNSLPPPIKQYFTDVHLVCLHKIPLTNQNFVLSASPQPSNASLPATLPTPSSVKSLLVTCSPSIMPLGPQTEQTSSLTQCNYKWRNTFSSPNQKASYQPARLSSLT